MQKIKRLHFDWVRSIRYLPELDALVSCCGETTTALACTALQDLKTKHFIVDKGVICFDYSTVSIVGRQLACVINSCICMYIHWCYCHLYKRFHLRIVHLYVFSAFDSRQLLTI